MIIKDYNFQQFLENIPTEKKIFLLHGTLISKIWYYRKLLELKLVGPKALQQMKLVLVDKSTIQKDKDNLLNEIKTRSFFGDKKAVVVNDISDKDIGLIKGIVDDYDIEEDYDGTCKTFHFYQNILHTLLDLMLFYLLIV